MDLSIIIVSFNTKKITEKCLVELKRNFIKYPLNYEVIVIDNSSVDGTSQLLKKLQTKWSNLRILLNNKNIGYGKANNIGLNMAKGKYILYLNSDAIIKDIDFKDIINLFTTQKDIGALTVKVGLPNGQIDPASHRGFPTLWRSFTYFSKLEKIFYNTPFLNKLFGGYHLAHLDLSTIHEIDACTGAFLFARKNILDKIGGFDKDFFMYGEDLELAYQIKIKGYKVLYYPLWKVLHLKYSSGLKGKNLDTKIKTKYYFYESMKIFYKKHYSKENFYLVNKLVYLFIDLKRKYFS